MALRQLRPLGPRTEKIYARMLERAFGDVEPPYPVPDIGDWPHGCRLLLRAAVRRRYAEQGFDPDDADALVPAKWVPQKAVRIPVERELEAYAHTASELPDGRRALALLPLAMGLRANEIIELRRDSVERAAQYGELLVFRKGGKEQMLPAEHAVDLFTEMLSVSRAEPRPTLEDEGEEFERFDEPWMYAGEILSPGVPKTQYNKLHALIRDTGKAAGLDGMHPHTMRHGFATRMARDGAPLPVVQWALGHANIQTTMRYVHPDAHDVKKYVRTY